MDYCYVLKIIIYIYIIFIMKIFYRGDKLKLFDFL